MKKNYLTLVVVSLVLASCKTDVKVETTTDVEKDTVTTRAEALPDPPLDSIAMQEAWNTYMTPGDMHKILADETGTWNCDMTFWMGPDAPPEKANSTAGIKMIMGGRYQQADYTGKVMGDDFEGRSIVAFDNAAKEFTSTWIDNMGTGIMVMKGKMDESSKSITFTGEMIDPATGKTKSAREVYTIVDKDTRKMEMYDTTVGNEFKSMEITMTRK